MASNQPSQITNVTSASLGFYQWPTLLPPNASNVANPSLKWRFGSRFVVPTVGLFSKFWMTVANSSTVYNANILYEALNQNYHSIKAANRIKEQQHQQSSISASSSGVSAVTNTITTVSAKSKSKINNKPVVLRPLITYSNHTSCLDDPLIWGALIPFRWQINSDRHRWSAAAAEVCFSNKWHSWFFSLGKTFPIVRGDGIYQPAMDYAYKLMKAGQWLHFFPEGKVIPRQENGDPSLLKFSYDENGQPVDLKRLSDSVSQKFGSFIEAHSYALKWGMARLIIEHVLGEGKQQDDEYSDALKTSFGDSGDCGPNNSMEAVAEVDILPIYHVGMDDVLPTRHPYVPRMFRRVTFLVRPEGPIRIDRNFLLRLFESSPSDDFNHNSSSSSNNNNSSSALKAIPESCTSIELSLTEKRIRLMKFLEDELTRLSSRAHWLHECLSTTTTTTSGTSSAPIQ